MSKPSTFWQKWFSIKIVLHILDGLEKFFFVPLPYIKYKTYTLFGKPFKWGIIRPTFILPQNQPPTPYFKTNPQTGNSKQQKGGGSKLTKTVFFILDNACPHAAHVTEYLLSNFDGMFSIIFFIFPSCPKRLVCSHN